MRRQLHVPENQIFAIANPDETDKSTERAKYFGILHCLSFGFDLNAEVILTKEMDGKEFDFFFALKLIKVPMMEIDDFLDYQLTQSFGGDHEKFKRYLKLLPRYISSELLQLEHEGNRLEFSADLDLSI